MLFRSRSVSHLAVDLQSLVTEITQSFEERIASLGAAITLQEPLPTVHGDKTLLSQVFVNLLDNALTYHRPGVAPRVTIGYSSTIAGPIISIADNGIGIASKHYERIFTIFQRLHSDDEFAGTGIGLAIVKKSVELMGGQIWVDAKVGEGSTFYMKLPH